MEKRYQVFVSSTYADLQDERQEVMQALLELDCIPAGMELFPAANEDQWTLIKRVIDDCDYYIVIIAGRYGSLGPDGVSYTEMEYRYATERRRPVISFLHRNPGLLPKDRCERTEDNTKKLDEFRNYVQRKMCRFWDSPADLGSQVSRSLIKLIKDNPAIGWVRGDMVPDISASEEILRLRKRVEELEAGLRATTLNAPEGTELLAQGEDIFELRFSFSSTMAGFLHKEFHQHKISLSWNEIFAAVSPLMIQETSEHNFKSAIVDLANRIGYHTLKLRDEFKESLLRDFQISSEDFQTIKVQLRALGLIAKSTRSRSVKDMGTYWTITPYGDTVMTRLRAIRRHLAGRESGGDTTTRSK